MPHGPRKDNSSTAPVPSAFTHSGQTRADLGEGRE